LAKRGNKHGKRPWIPNWQSVFEPQKQVASTEPINVQMYQLTWLNRCRLTQNKIRQREGDPQERDTQDTYVDNSEGKRERERERQLRESHPYWNKITDAACCHSWLNLPPQIDDDQSK
jgi:hypothetical protein